MNVDVSEYAFDDDVMLHNVKLEDGVRKIEYYGFGGCTNLFEIAIPSSVTNINRYAFSGCDNLTNIFFDGHVPAGFSDDVLPANCKCIVPDALRDEWVAAITVDNISAFTASKYDNADIVTDEWISKYPELSSYRARGNKIDVGAMYTGKLDANGNRMQVWHDFILGTDPTDLEDKFTVTIEIVGGEPVVTWSPDLNESGTRSVRTYTTLGCESIGGEWKDMSTVLESEKSKYHFFKVSVEMP